MLHEFITANRAALIDSCKENAFAKAPGADRVALQRGVVLFLDQLVERLRVERADPAKNVAPRTQIADSASLHGRKLVEAGFTLEQAVGDYGNVGEAIAQLATDRQAPVRADEFRILNRCLNEAITFAVMEFASVREARAAEAGVQALGERLGFLAHELRNLVHNATLALEVVKAGDAGVRGATVGVIERSLAGLRTLVDRSLADVRVTAGLPARRQLVSIADFVADVKSAAALEARLRECEFTVPVVDPALSVDADRPMLLSAVTNLLQNAFKFTRPRTGVSLNVRASTDRVLIEVEDHCGGLPPGDTRRLFMPFTQNGADRSGLGLGLAICRRCVEANKGVVSVRDLPGSGCVFTVDLPRYRTMGSAVISAAASG